MRAELVPRHPASPCLSALDDGTLWDGTSRLLIGAAVDESGCLVLPTDPCLSVLIFWISPFVTACAGLVGAALALLLSRSFRTDGSTGGGVSQGGRVMIYGVIVAFACMWVSASIAGASMGLSKVITLGIFALVVIMTVLIDRLFGWRAILSAIVTREPLARRLVRFFITSDWSRAIAFSITLPLLICIVILSIGNQFIRVHLLNSIVLPGEHKLWTTAKIANVLNRMKSWNWTSVLRKVIVLSCFYMIWSVGVMKVTIVFFSWLSYELTQVSLMISTGVFIGVGMTMFLLPPVPGAPVYMASGVLLTAAAQPRFGYWPACAYAMGVAYCIKLGACCLQQKVIGANLRRSVSIRSACMVNSPLMRSIKVRVQPRLMQRLWQPSPFACSRRAYAPLLPPHTPTRGRLCSPLSSARSC